MLRKRAPSTALSLFLRARWVRQRGLCTNSEPYVGYSTSSMLSTMRLSDLTRHILPSTTAIQRHGHLLCVRVSYFIS